MTKLRTLLALSALGLGALWAQSSATNDAVTRVVRATVANDRDDGIAASWQALLDDLFREIDDRLDREGEQMLARRRADIRNGASSGAAGSTTAALNPLLPAAFGFSFENGSVVRTISGNSVTIAVNPAGLICASRVGVAPVALREQGCQDFWRRWGVSLTFDTSRGKNPPPTASTLKPLADQFAEAAVRFEVVNQRKPGSARFHEGLKAWEKDAKAAADPINLLQVKLTPFRKEFETQMGAAIGRFQPSDTEQQKIDALLKVVRDVKAGIANADPEVSALLRGAANKWRDTLKADNALYNTFAHGWVAPAEYALERPDIATEAVGTIVPAGTRPPSLHTARLVVARGLLNYNLDFTLNFSSSWFDEKRPEMTSLWRNVQVAGDAKWRLRDIADFGTPTFLMAGLYMYLNQRPLGFDIPQFAGTQINEPGHVGVFQAKLELPTANAAVRIPISFSYSNRTDLIKERDVRGQIGISLNLDSVFADPAKK